MVSFRSRKGGEQNMIVYRELSSLEKDLGVPARTLYAVSNRLSRHYRTVSIPKSGGGERHLSVPDPVLRQIQRRIARQLLAYMPVSGHATAYRPGGSALRNARPHAGAPMLLRLDIRDFFSSVLYSTVKERAFPSSIYAEPLRVLLSMLCYYQDGLPQGAPTSPAIANIILYDFDRAVGRWCGEHGVVYTRYCDDMAFSGRFDPDHVIRMVRDRLRELGLFLNDGKTKLMYPGRRQTVTGVVVNQTPAVPVEYRRALRQELYFCRRFGVEEHLRRRGVSDPPRVYLTRLLGRVNYVLQITPDRREMLEYQDWLRLALTEKKNGNFCEKE